MRVLTTKRSVFGLNEDLISWERFPCIVKPSDSSAGRGVSYCSNSESLNNNLTKAINFSKNGK